MSSHREGWEQLLQQLQDRTRVATAMGGEERIERQHSRHRLTARERVDALCDNGSFNEVGALAGGNHPGGEPPVPADALIGVERSVSSVAVLLIIVPLPRGVST